MIEVAILVAVLSGGAIALRHLASRGDDREVNEIWETAARRVGGEVEITERRWARPAERRIRLTVEGVPVLVESYRVSSGNSSSISTRVIAGPVLAARATRIHCSKRNLVRKVSKRLGIGELPTGHPIFDEQVHVSGAPHSLVLVFLDGPTRLLIADSDAGFDFEDSLVIVDREGAPSESAPLIAMTRFAERLVQRWCALMRGPARLAESLALTVDETSQLEAGTGPIARGVHRSRPVTLSLRASNDIVLTVLSFDDAHGGAWTMERDAGDTLATSDQTPEAVRAFASIAPASLLGMRAIDGKIELAFDGLAPDHDEVATSLDAMLDATTPLAPYR